MDTDWLLKPEKLYSRAEVLEKPCPVPAEAGIYGWYFNHPPELIPVDNVHEHNGHQLLYVGIAPKKPAVADKPSSRTLRNRIREHYSLNGYGSTLRLTLGCVLGLELRRISSKKNPGTAKRMTFGRSGEQQLSRWMDDHAFVVWEACDNAWDVEHQLLAQLDSRSTSMTIATVAFTPPSRISAPAPRKQPESCLRSTDRHVYRSVGLLV